MRVLHVLHNSLPLLCGYSIRSGYILRSQREFGIEPAALTSPQNPDPGATAAGDVTLDGIRHYRTPPVRHAGASLPLLREWRLMRRFQRRIEDVIRLERPDFVHAHSPVLVGLPAIRAARRSGLPFVYEVRDLWENASVDHGRFRHGSPLYRLARAAETELLRRADAVVSLCTTLRDELEPRARQVVHVVDNGVDTATFAPAGDAPDIRRKWGCVGRRVLAYVGTFQPYEGLDLLIDAMTRVIVQEPNAHLLIAGGTADASETVGDQLRAAADRNGLAGHVTFLGRVPHAQVHEIYQVADAVVYPRRLTRTTALTTPLKPLEAMAMGRAVAASDIPPMRELVTSGETGLLFAPGDSRALAEACLTLIREPALRARLGAQARAWTLRERGWHGLVGRYQGVYEQARGRLAAPGKEGPACRIHTL